MLSEKRKNLFDCLKKNYPKSFLEIRKNNLISPHLFSPFLLKLPLSVFTQVKRFVTNIYRIKDSESYQSKLSGDMNWRNWPKPPSLLTCFDFHYSEEMGLKLVEINTNASLYISSHIFLEAQKEVTPDPGMKNLLKSFKKSLSLKPGDCVHILDRDPEKEGLYFEFLLFQEWLESHGYTAEILSLDKYKDEAVGKIQKVYNRFTDFYFSEPESGLLKDDYVNKRVIFSPNPREYFLLSDKKRQKLLKNELEMLDPELADIIPQSRLFSEFGSREILWGERKKYFLKPSQSHGGKGVFKGKTISRKTFNDIYAPDFVAQELCPAGQKTFDYEGESLVLKFDLRFHVFEGEIQNHIARLYQGQTTNMKTKWGGLVPIRYV